MKMTVLSGSIAAVCLAGGLAAAAQVPAQSSSSTSAAQSTPPAAITVAGCVQQEASVLKRNAAVGEVGMSDEFVLTQSILNPRPPTDQPKSETEPPPAAAVGTSGSVSNFGKVYRVTGDKENELKTYVGQRVEITGAFKNDAEAKAELASAGIKGRSTGAELTPANTPEITIAAIRPVAGSCSGGGDR
jgi:hypothetical protein